MVRQKRFAPVALLLCLLLAMAAVAADRVQKSAQSADVFSDKFIYKWDKNLFEFTGNCRVEIKGPDSATMVAPKMTGKLAGNSNQITEITAIGPVKFDILTKKDEQGVQRMIKAGCAGEAVYTGGTKVVTLGGGAEAVMTTIPQDPDMQPAMFTGNKLVINLTDFTITGDNVHIEMQVPAEALEGKKAP